MKKILSLKNSSIAGIVYLVSFLLSGVFYFLGMGNLFGSQQGNLIFSLFVVTSSFMVVAHLFFFLGFSHLGRVAGKKFVRVTAIILMAIDVCTALFFALMAIIPQGVSENLAGTAVVFSLLRVVLTAAVNLAFGIALFGLKKEFGKIATAAGVLTVITSVVMGSIMAAPLALIMMIPVTILEIILLYRAAKKYQV